MSVLRKSVTVAAMLLGFVPTKINVAQRLRHVTGRFSASRSERGFRYFGVVVMLVLIPVAFTGAVEAWGRPLDRPIAVVFLVQIPAMVALAAYAFVSAHRTIVLESGQISVESRSGRVQWAESLASLERVLITRARGNNYSMQLIWPHKTRRVVLWDSLRDNITGP